MNTKEPFSPAFFGKRPMEFCVIRVESPFFLAPMAAITSLPFRLMCKKQGAGLVITEQINATQIARNPDPFTNNEFFTIKTTAEEKPVGVQLFGAVEKDFIAAVETVEKDFEFININCGCPSHRETSIGAGAALLKEPEKIAGIVKAIAGVTEKPVTAKIRLGWSENKSVAIAKTIEKAGADAIMVHGRTASAGYSGKADWDAIGKIVKELSIPVVANGDVNSGKAAQQMLEVTGANFGMIGRCAMTNPYIFREIKAWFDEKVEWKPSAREKIGGFFNYLEACEKYDMVKLTDLKLKAVQFTKGIEFTKQTRVELQAAQNLDEIKACLERFAAVLENESKIKEQMQAIN